MRRLFALAFALALAGCSESYAPTAPDPVAPVPAAVQDPDAPGGGATAAAASYGVDDVGDSCNSAKAIVLVVGGRDGEGVRDEINTSTDKDAFLFISDPAEQNYRWRATGKAPAPVICRLRRWENGEWRLLYTDGDGMDCDFSYRSPATRTYCLTVSGLNGAYGPDNVWSRVT